jgi:hypothetical protein
LDLVRRSKESTSSWPCQCSWRNFLIKSPDWPDLPRTLYLGHEPNRRLRVHPLPPQKQSPVWAQPYSIRSFLLQASENLGGCSYNCAIQGVVMDETIFADFVSHRTFSMRAGERGRAGIVTSPEDGLTGKIRVHYGRTSPSFARPIQSADFYTAISVIPSIGHFLCCCRRPGSGLLNEDDRTLSPSYHCNIGTTNGSPSNSMALTLKTKNFPIRSGTLI